MRRALLVACALAVFGCGHYVPARFADRPPVTLIDDAQPIAVPERSDFVESEYLSDAYLRRPIVDALDVSRTPYAADVNALDQVPRSSFYNRELPSLGTAPQPPFTVEGVDRSGDDLTLSVTDALGRRFELRHDPAGLSQTRTAAAVIASRLTREIGYLTVPVWALDLDKAALRIGPIDDLVRAPHFQDAIDRFMDKYLRRRISATAWPVGIDLGPTPMSGTRDDDANDRIEHEDRRTLRALPVFAAWLDATDLGPHRLRDVYVGRPPHGHVDHMLVQLDTALGVHRLMQDIPVERAVGVLRGSALRNLATLGLSRGGKSSERPAAPSLVVLPGRVDPGTRPGQAAAFDRLEAPDGYWAAKILVAMRSGVIHRAVDAGRIDDRAVAKHVEEALAQRRRTLVAYWMSRVTPCEVALVSGTRLVLEDRAMQAGVATRARSRYAAVVLADDGTLLGRPTVRSLGGVRSQLEVPEGLLVRRGYLVVRVTAFRDGKPLPRAFEIHVVPRARGLAVIGVRH